MGRPSKHPGSSDLGGVRYLGAVQRFLSALTTHMAKYWAPPP